MVKGSCGNGALLSGNWNNATNAGTFNWNLNNASSNVNQNIGTQLANFVIKIVSAKPCLLAKHSNEKPRAGRGGTALERSVGLQRRCIL